MWLQSARWSRQPRNALGINRGHPLASSLIFYALPQGNRPVDLVTGNAANPTGLQSTISFELLNGGTARIGDDGVFCAKTNGTNSWSWRAGDTRLDSADRNGAVPTTLMILSKAFTASPLPVHLCSAENFNGHGFGIVSDDNLFSGPGCICAAINSGGVNATGSPNNALTATPSQKLHMFGYGIDGTNGYTYWQGRNSNSFAQANTIGATAGRNTNIGRAYPGASQYVVALALGMAFNKILTLAEYSMLWDDPWALVNSQKAKFFIIPSGGSVFSGSVAEVLTAADTTDTNVVFASSLAETLTAAETQTGAATYPVSLAETLTAVETQSSTMTVIGAVAETLTVADTPSSTVIFSSTLAEVLTTAETVNSNAIMGVSVAEVLTAIETSTGNIAGGGNAVTFLSGVSAYDDSGGVTKKIIKLVDLGGGFYTVTYVSGVSENKVDSVHKEWYIIT